MDGVKRKSRSTDIKVPIPLATIDWAESKIEILELTAIEMENISEPSKDHDQRHKTNDFGFRDEKEGKQS